MAAGRRGAEPPATPANRRKRHRAITQALAARLRLHARRCGLRVAPHGRERTGAHRLDGRRHPTGGAERKATAAFQLFPPALCGSDQPAYRSAARTRGHVSARASRRARQHSGGRPAEHAPVAAAQPGAAARRTAGAATTKPPSGAHTLHPLGRVPRPRGAARYPYGTAASRTRGRQHRMPASSSQRPRCGRGAHDASRAARRQRRASRPSAGRVTRQRQPDCGQR